MAAVSITNLEVEATGKPIRKNGVTAYPSRAFDITIGDTYNAPVTVYVGVTGDVVVIPYDGDETGASNSCTFVGVLAGATVPVAVRQVVSSGTTATTLVGIIG